MLSSGVERFRIFLDNRSVRFLKFLMFSSSKLPAKRDTVAIVTAENRGHPRCRMGNDLAVQSQD